MTETLLIEMGLTCALAAVLGYALGKFRGFGILGGITLIANGLTLLAAFPVVAQSNVSARSEIVILEIAIWTYVASGILGYFLTDMLGSFILEMGTLGAALGCFYPPTLLGRLHEWLGALALLVAVILIGTIGTRVFSQKILRGQGAPFLRLLWFGFCGTCLIGYFIAGRLGLLLITLPAQLIFWGFLYLFSQYILPIDHDQRSLAFRSLITFALGTNYPYYVIEDWQTRENHEQQRPDPRVPGNSFNQFLAGPGIILNDSNHVTVTSTGFRLRVAPPGLSFTWKFEDLLAAVDLRPQLCVHKNIKAETADGISVEILTFMPHRIQTGGRKLELGRSYPYDNDAVLQAVFHQGAIEHQWERDEAGQATEDINKIPWNELVLSVGPSVLKSIILKYTCNGLHTPGDPRVDIASAFRDQLREAVKPYGIEMVGGGIGDIKPPKEVVEQRIENWKARWKSRIEIELGETMAAITREKDTVWAEAQLQVMSKLIGILKGADAVSQEVLAFQLIEALTTGALSEPDQQPASEGSLTGKYLISRGR